VVKGDWSASATVATRQSHELASATATPPQASKVCPALGKPVENLLLLRALPLIQLQDCRTLGSLRGWPAFAHRRPSVHSSFCQPWQRAARKTHGRRAICSALMSPLSSESFAAVSRRPSLSANAAIADTEKARRLGPALCRGDELEHWWHKAPLPNVLDTLSELHDDVPQP